MANYIIIGGDNKEYGPVSESELRQWILEGRLNAESRVKAEGAAEFSSLARVPELAPYLRPQGDSEAVTSLATPADFLDRDYELDIGGCFLRAWQLFKAKIGLLLGLFLLFFLFRIAYGAALGLIPTPFNNAFLQNRAAIAVGCRFIATAALSPVMGPLAGGLMLVFLKTIRGQPTGVKEVFAGFQMAYRQLFLGHLVISSINFLCLLPFLFVFQTKTGPLQEQMQHLQGDPAGMQSLLPQFLPAITASLPVLLVCLVPATFFTVSLQFTLPLIIDRRINFGPAMKTSWRMVAKHWWPVCGLSLLAGLVSFLGLFACCVGILFTVAIAQTAMLYAYETIFGAHKN